MTVVYIYIDKIWREIYLNNIRRINFFKNIKYFMNSSIYT